MMVDASINRPAYRDRHERISFVDMKKQTPEGPPVPADREADELILKAILGEHQGAIYGYLRSRVFQAADAEDLTQEVFLRWCQNRHRFDDSRKVRPWLLGIARNVLREHIKRTQNRKEIAWTELCLHLEQLLDTKDDDDSHYIEVLPHLPGCLQELGPSSRQALMLHYHANLSLANIAEQLHRSVGAVKLLMFRARQFLKQCLASKMNAHRA